VRNKPILLTIEFKSKDLGEIKQAAGKLGADG
jgi:hypothetical protein